jgi:granule-bound starch synthase
MQVLLKDVYQPAGRCLDTKCALTIHNIAFQGRFWESTWADLGLPEASKPRFEFSDGYPLVFDETMPADETGKLPVVVRGGAAGRGDRGGDKGG